jgi:hypothetical protein
MDRNKSDLVVIVQRDSYGHIVEIFGTFESTELAMRWLEETGVPNWTAGLRDEETCGVQVDVGFFGNGASDGTTHTCWNARHIRRPQ